MPNMNLACVNGTCLIFYFIFSAYKKSTKSKHIDLVSLKFYSILSIEKEKNKTKKKKKLFQTAMLY